MKKILAALVVLVGVFSVVGVMVATPVMAGSTCAGVDTALISCPDDSPNNPGGGIWAILAIVVQVLTFAVGALAAIGIVVSAVQYATAGDDVGKVANSKKRILQIAIGLVAYALMTTIAQFLIPGGVF